MTNWVLVPVRNGLQYTRAALPTLLAQDLGGIAVMLIDNCSTDGTKEWAMSLPSNVTYWRQQRPLSVAESWNKGLRLIFSNEENRHCLVVNNDTEMRPDTYRHLIADGGEFVTAVGVNDKGCLKLPDGLHWHPDPDPYRKRPNPDYSCYLIRRECFRRVPFDENTQVGFVEDCLHHVALHRAGIRAYCLDLPFYHVGSATIKNAEPDEEKRISEAAGRNREYFFSKYGCYPGTPEYEALFSEETFGCDATAAGAGIQQSQEQQE